MDRFDRYSRGHDEGGDDYRQNNWRNERIVFDGKRMRKPVTRRTVDNRASIIRAYHSLPFSNPLTDMPDIDFVEPEPHHARNMLLPSSYIRNPSVSYTTKFIDSSVNKDRFQIHCVEWAPEGKRIITGAESGEFTLWNGYEFNFETITQAHDNPIRSMQWSHNEVWLLSGDQTGVLKYWQASLNNVKVLPAHSECIRCITFAPSDRKFATCSEDQTIKLWDFAECKCESTLKGHGWDVRVVRWHPRQAVLVSGSKDNLMKFWDPKSGKCVATVHSHKNTVSDLQWNRNGNWLLSGSRDNLLKLHDIRNLKQEVVSYLGHTREVSSCHWHPEHEALFVSGAADGNIFFHHADRPDPQAKILNAHDSVINSIRWHPLGNLIVSGSSDTSVKFWTRNHPGDRGLDRFNGGPPTADDKEPSIFDPLMDESAKRDRRVVEVSRVIRESGPRNFAAANETERKFNTRR